MKKFGKMGAIKGMRGTWSFRSSIPLKYDPRVLVSNWHEAQLSHPLDYDYSKPENMDLQRSSYHNFWFGEKTAPLPKSTTHEMMEEALDWYGMKKVTRHPYLDKENWGRHHIDRRIQNYYPRGVTSMVATGPSGMPSRDTEYKVPAYYRKPTHTISTQTNERMQWLNPDEPLSSYEKDTQTYNYLGFPKWHQQDYVLYPCYEPWSVAHRTDPILKARKPERFLL